MERHYSSEIRSELPLTSVPEHMVLLSFNSDCFAEEFDNWWGDKGERLFTFYLAELQDEK